MNQEQTIAFPAPTTWEKLTQFKFVLGDLLTPRTELDQIKYETFLHSKLGDKHKELDEVQKQLQTQPYVFTINHYPYTALTAHLPSGETQQLIMWCAQKVRQLKGFTKVIEYELFKAGYHFVDLVWWMGKEAPDSVPIPKIHILLKTK